MRYRPIEERFAEKYLVDRQTKCWNWTGTTVTGGYGMIRLPRSAGAVLSHRLSYELHVGEIPDGMLVCHSCDNPGCVNPDHLFLATHHENMRDMERKGRARILTPKQVGIVRAMLAAGQSQAAAAERFGVSRATIYDAIRREAVGGKGATGVLGRYVKITDRDRAKARAMLKAGRSIKSIAEHFGVDRKVIRKLVE